MPNPRSSRRPSVTSDPDRGVPVNSGTDPQRPGQPAKRMPDAPGTAEGTPSPGGSAPTRRPVSTESEDVERGPRRGEEPVEQG